MGIGGALCHFTDEEAWNQAERLIAPLLQKKSDSSPIFPLIAQGVGAWVALLRG